MRTIKILFGGLGDAMKLSEWLKTLDGQQVRYTRRFCGNVERQHGPDPEDRPHEQHVFTVKASDVRRTSEKDWMVTTGKGILCYDRDPERNGTMARIMQDAPSGNIFCDTFELEVSAAIRGVSGRFKPENPDELEVARQLEAAV
ncbi:MAG: hypothetical protein ACKV2Q_13555 [Planctomycetaceae bacterium]